MKIIVSDFVRRQTPESRFSHFEGTEAELIQRTEQAFADAITGYRLGVLRVPVDPEGFLSSTINLRPGDRLVGVYRARQAGEDPRKQIGVLWGQKLPARKVEIILYSAAVLEEGNERTLGACPECHKYRDFCPYCDGAGRVPVDCDYEIVSINASPTEGPEPMTVGTLLANHFHVPGSHDGGTSTGMTDQEFIEALRESFGYWQTRGTIADPALVTELREML